MSGPELDSLPQGTIVAGRYEILSKLGEGGMGAVYLADQIRLGRHMALKVILPEHAARKGARTRFEREARTASALRHNGAVEIYDFGEYEGSLYLAMELLRGYPLRDVVDIDLPLLKLTRTLNWAEQVADVLTSACDIGLVHRDLKPENVMIEPGRDGDERVVVVDFGLAFMMEREDAGRMTREGVVTGTPDYMSPEQARGSDVGPESDIYSFGCMLYEMCTGSAPFTGDTAILISRHLFVAPTPMREAYPDLELPGPLVDLVSAMLAKHPEERPTAEKVRDTLRKIDPAAPQRHGATTEGGKLVGRAARMVSQHPRTGAASFAPTEFGPRPDVIPGVQMLLGIYGDVSETLTLALAANGLARATVPPGADADGVTALGCRAIFAPGVEPDALSALSAAGVPIVTDADAGDMDRLALMLRAGAAEVVVRPVAAEEVARKVRRAIRKKERKR